MGQVPESVARAALERRLGLRVTLGRPVGVRLGLRVREATLVDLSVTGARVQFPETVSVGRTLRLVLPGAPRYSRGIAALVVRLEGESASHPTIVAVEFTRPSRAESNRLRDAVVGGMAGRPDDRRDSERVPYRRRVIARGPNKPQVLVGTDLCEGGMRIEQADLALGTEVEVALHAGGNLAPLVVPATVVRREADGAAGLAFINLDSAQRGHLAKLVNEHPLIRDADGTPVVLSEVLLGN